MIKNKLSDLISIQLPDHIRESYPTFVEFLQAYYKFLETQNVYRNLETVRDVDETIDIFIDQLKKEFAVDYPQFAKDRQFLKNTPHIAVAHGSEESYKFLFRKMFQKEVDIRYPREQLLTISDSKWVQDFSIFVKLTSGDILSLQNNVVFLNTKVNGISTKNRIYVKRVESVLTSESIYELFINKDVYGKVLFGDTINQDGVVASVVNTTSAVKIKKAGFGFKIGQVFNIESDVGSGLTFKVTEVTPLGGIKSTQIINYGINYKSSFSFDLPSTFLIGDVVETTLGSPIKISAFSSIQRYIDSGIVSKQNYYTSDYSTDYVGEVMTSFNSVTVAEEITANSAQLEVVLGTLAKYQGYYENSTGLVSSPDSVIQDNNYYQKYSYVLRIDEALASYKETVMSLLHPIGRKLFAEYVVDNIFELDYEVVEPVFRILLPLFAGIPTVVNVLADLDLLINKPISSVQLIGSDDIYLFEKVTNIPLTSFDDPTLLDVVSGRVKGSFKTYFFDSLKASGVEAQSDDYWLFEQPQSSTNVLPVTQLVELLVGKDLQSSQLTEFERVYLFDSLKESSISTPISDDFYLFDSQKESILPQQEFLLFYDMSQILNTSLVDQTFVAAKETARPVVSSLADQTFVAAKETARPVESSISTPVSGFTEFIVNLGPDSPITIESPLPIFVNDLVLNSSAPPQSDIEKSSSIILTTTTATLGSSAPYTFLPSYSSGVTINFGIDVLKGTLFESEVIAGSSPSLDFAPPILVSPVTPTDNDVLLINKGISSSTINSDSGNVFLNPYIQNMTSSVSYFADETYLARTRTF
jgi:hypothetical protein